MATRGSEAAPSWKQKEGWGRDRRTPRPAESCNARKAVAWGIVRSLLARGRVFVRATCESKSLSHMSLIVQPAPRMTKAPVPKRAMRGKCWRIEGEARQVDQRQG